MAGLKELNVRLENIKFFSNLNDSIILIYLLLADNFLHTHIRILTLTFPNP